MEQRYVLVLCDGEWQIATIRQRVKDLVSGQQATSCAPMSTQSVVVALASPSMIAGWGPVQETNEWPTEASEDPSADMCARAHRLLDEVGDIEIAVLDAIWVTEGTASPLEEDAVDMYGVLKRIHERYSSHVHIITDELEGAKHTLLWAGLFGATVSWEGGVGEWSLMPHVWWRGELGIAGQTMEPDQDALSFGRLCLSLPPSRSSAHAQENAAPPPPFAKPWGTLKVVDVVDIASVPSHFLSGWRLDLRCEGEDTIGAANELLRGWWKCSRLADNRPGLLVDAYYYDGPTTTTAWHDRVLMGAPRAFQETKKPVLACQLLLRCVVADGQWSAHVLPLPSEFGAISQAHQALVNSLASTSKLQSRVPLYRGSPTTWIEQLAALMKTTPRIVQSADLDEAAKARASAMVDASYSAELPEARTFSKVHSTDTCLRQALPTSSGDQGRFVPEASRTHDRPGGTGEILAAFHANGVPKKRGKRVALQKDRKSLFFDYDKMARHPLSTTASAPMLSPRTAFSSKWTSEARRRRGVPHEELRSCRLHGIEYLTTAVSDREQQLVGFWQEHMTRGEASSSLITGGRHLRRPRPSSSSRGPSVTRTSRRSIRSVIKRQKAAYEELNEVDAQDKRESGKTVEQRNKQQLKHVAKKQVGVSLSSVHPKFDQCVKKLFQILCVLMLDMKVAPIPEDLMVEAAQRQCMPLLLQYMTESELKKAKESLRARPSKKRGREDDALAGLHFPAGSFKTPEETPDTIPPPPKRPRGAHGVLQWDQCLSSDPPGRPPAGHSSSMLSPPTRLRLSERSSEMRSPPDIPRMRHLRSGHLFVTASDSSPVTNRE